MIRRINLTLLTASCLIANAVLAQNLVPNESFESYDSLSCDFIDLLPSKSWKARFNLILTDWKMPTQGTPNVFSLVLDADCQSHPFGTRGVPIPKDGENMIALYNTYGAAIFDYREYIQVELKEPLSIGRRYICGYYTARSPVYNASNNMGMAFSVEEIGSDTATLLNYRPQINDASIKKDTEWVLFYQSFKATNESRYLTIGNFYNNADTRVIISHPTINAAYYFIDSVFVEPVIDLVIPNVITPNGDCCNERFIIGNLQVNRWTLKILNRWGQIVFYSSNYANDWSGENLDGGVYFYEVQHLFAQEIIFKGTLTVIH